MAKEDNQNTEGVISTANNSVIKYFHRMWNYLEIPHGLIDPKPIYDMMLLRDFFQTDIRLPTAQQKNDRIKQGALVISPPKGIFEWVVIMDFSQHYPRIIRDFNISPETLDPNGEIITENNIRFKKPSEKMGIFPSYVNHLLEWRYSVEAELKKYDVTDPKYHELKDLIMAIKQTVNAMYGVMGNPEFRISNRYLGESVTANGRKGLLIASEVARELGYTPLYGDTDSIFIQIDPPSDPTMTSPNWYKETLEKIQELEDAINDRIHEWEIACGVEKPTMKMSFEALMNKIALFGAKKKYFAFICYDGKKGDIHTAPLKDRLKIRGLEVIRSDSATLTKELQTTLIKMIFENKSPEELLAYLHKVYLDILNGKYSYRLFLRGKKLDESKSKTSQHIRASIVGREQFGWDYKGYIYLLYVYPSPLTKGMNVIGLPSTTTPLPEGIKVDYKTNAQQIMKNTYDLFMTKLFRYPQEWLYTGTVTKSIEHEIRKTKVDDLLDDLVSID